ncbi:hypothetical protein [Ralstonia pseudosolanacearum]|uniref:hypothetical protein n=1 Tax=Ralstonia pseudosolanacearum TaxID=1310165 RepID=UPI002234CBAC|nr:hypothetical protein [Ralstonia sp. RS642]UZF25205.1 hypothetical protein LGV80_01160 [Ralstonia sp. RS642]
MITKPLTPAQRAILTRAIKDSNGRLDWFPETVKGGARLFALNGLANRTLIAKSGTDWLVTPAGYRVIEMLELNTSQAAAPRLRGRTVLGDYAQTTAYARTPS